MEYGIFTSPLLEIAQTKYWTICFSCSADQMILNAELYNGIDENKTLAAIVRRNNESKRTIYAYELPGGQIFTNDAEGMKALIGQKYSYSTHGMKINDTIQISKPYEMPSFSQGGIKNCLKQWRMGTFYRFFSPNGMLFQMVTNKVEYVFSIQDENCNIYCGASVNIPCEDGMLGAGQYFRIRNFGDNTQPFCRFECHLGQEIPLSTSPMMVCESGACSITEQGIIWPLKRYSDDEIILSGCGDDEYIYHRNHAGRSEYFSRSACR